MKYFKNYIKNSKSPLYSLIFTTPLLLAYEFLIFNMNQSDISGIRNGADVLIRRIFHHFNIYGFYFVGFIVLLAIFLTYYFRTQKGQNIEIKLQFFSLMLCESGLYAIALLFILNQSGQYLAIPAFSNLNRHMFTMALGAGIYEEFVFRVIMISAGVFFFHKILRWDINTSKILAIMLAAILFSAFHYIGHLGDSFQMKSFIIRLIAGLVLSIIYIFRGYGITVYTHTFYDLIIIYL